MAFGQKDIDNMNERIKQWDEKDLNDLRSEMDRLGIQHSKNSPNKIPLRKALKSKLTQRNGLTNKIAYSMPVSSIFLHKGVSRGHPKSNPREAKEWFNPVVDKNLDELADIVADEQGTMVINAINIK